MWQPIKNFHCQCKGSPLPFDVPKYLDVSWVAKIDFLTIRKALQNDPGLGRGGGDHKGGGEGRACSLNIFVTKLTM